MGRVLQHTCVTAKAEYTPEWAWKHENMFCPYWGLNRNHPLLSPVPYTMSYPRPSFKNDSPKWSTHGKLGIIKITEVKESNENTPGMHVKDTESLKQIRPEITTLRLMTPNCHLPPGSSVTRLPWWQPDMVCKLSKTFMLHDVAIQDKWTITD